MPANETVLITGASSGIGLELARVFAESGSDLILVARSEDKLQHLGQQFRSGYGVNARVLAKDLSDPEAPRELYDALSADDVPVHVLVNNAGFGAKGTVAELDEQRQMDMIQVNVSAVTHLTRLFLPDLLKRGRGGILNVASTAAFQPGPSMTVYYATKAYVLSFTEGLAEELRGTGVTASCLAPGPTDTGFQKEAGMDESRLFKMNVRSAGDVARAGYKGFRKGQVVIVPGLASKAGTLAIRLAPRSIIRRAVQFLHE